MELTWSARCLESIRKEKAEAEKRYGIRISQTQIYCIWCGKPADFFHTCPNMSQERREEIEGIQEEFNRPVSLLGSSGWRIELEIELGMSKEEALEKFREWQQSKKTCQRCECDKYIQFCPIHLICEEAQNERNAKGDDNRGRAFETDELETIRTEISSARKRTSLR